MLHLDLTFYERTSVLSALYLAQKHLADPSRYSDLGEKLERAFAAGYPEDEMEMQPDFDDEPLAKTCGETADVETIGALA